MIIAKGLPPNHPANIELLEAKADVARACGKPTDAERHLRAALSVAEKLFEQAYPLRRATIDRLTAELWAQGKFAVAERLQREQLSNFELKLGFEHPSTAIPSR